ncbi:hypothetical protein [Dyadobacter sp. 3J3]|uniref:hypothetical protein n=1 Tax=Dyadobacter sp. 3J3 TaxID=2606600 RepID=UPI00135BF7E3|nr:hypothetical protein [Dyadobacter sp. 3J3]
MEDSTNEGMSLWKKILIGFVLLVFTANIIDGYFIKHDSKPEEGVKALFSIKEISGKSITDVEKIFGKGHLESKWKDKKSGCKACPKYLYQGGKYEVIFIDKVADRITINKLNDYEFTNKAIMGIIGLSEATPSFQTDFVKRWNFHGGYREIMAFEEKNKVNYILILSKAP